MTALELEDERGKGKCIVVAVKVGAHSFELLTWALVKATQPGDHVVALHVITDSELSLKEQRKTNHESADFVNSAVEVYEGFCSLKQVHLQFKITHGSSVRKVLVEEAKLYEATKVVVGASKHKALGFSISLAKYCMKKIPCSTSVLVVKNGKAIFEKCGTQHLSVTSSAPWLQLFNSKQWRIKSKNCKLLNNSAGTVVKCPLETTVVISPSRYGSDKHYNTRDVGLEHDHLKISPVNIVNVCKHALSEKGALEKSFLPLQSKCALCESNIHAIVCSEKRYERHEVKDLTSQSSCESVYTVSSTSSLISSGEENNSYTRLHSEIPKEGMPGVHIQKGESSSGWPLLRRAMSFSKVSRRQPIERQISVVEWAMQLPNRQSQMTEQAKAQILHEAQIQECRMQASNTGKAGSPCVQNNFYDCDECFLTKKLEFLCESKACKRFTYEELQSATFNFSTENFIGSGGWSQVYRGVLSDGQSLAVKVLNCSSIAEQDLLMEVGILTSLRHKHIISLVGYCVENHSRLLVYNFVSRGNLEENLHGGKDKPVLSWVERFKVAVGVAEALDYLHKGCSPSVIHRDVKSSNILLTDDFEPQLSDFGLAKWAPTTSSHITCSDVLGTFGYLAPEYFIYGKVNHKTDVYAFGVVLLELITGRRSIDTTYPKGQESLVVWSKPLLEEENMGELVDQRLQDAYIPSEMQRMILAASLCIAQSSQYRPHMNHILKILRGEQAITDWTWCRHIMTKDTDGSDEDEHIVNQGENGIQTHLALAMLGVDDDGLSMSSIDNSVDIFQAKESLEDYLKGRCNYSATFT